LGVTLWAAIPVKPFQLGKSRLAAALAEEDRFALNRCLFENTLSILTSVPEVERVLVISRDPQVLSLARRQQAMTIQESGGSDLNAALQKASQVTQRYRIQSLLILPADLPLVNAPDIQVLAGLANSPPVVAIAPDRHQAGTNALLVSPVGLIRFTFGEESLERHSQAARQAGARLEVLDLPRLALDLDTPEDIEYLKKVNLDADSK
jgi:2-phospho-L-lactate guanylyltransferase